MNRSKTNTATSLKKRSIATAGGLRNSVSPCKENEEITPQLQVLRPKLFEDNIDITHVRHTSVIEQKQAEPQMAKPL